MITGEKLIAREQRRPKYGRARIALTATALLVAAACTDGQSPAPEPTTDPKTEALIKGQDIAATLSHGQVYQKAQVMHGHELPIEAECPPEVSEGKFMVSYRAHAPIKLADNIYGYFAPYDKGGKALEVVSFDGQLVTSPEVTTPSEQTMDVAFISYPSGYEAVVSGAGPGLVTHEQADSAQRVGEMSWQSYREGESCVEARNVIARFPIDLVN